MGLWYRHGVQETKDGPTIWEDHFYPEIINPQTDEVLPDGEYGELVLPPNQRSHAHYSLPNPWFNALTTRTARPMRRMIKSLAVVTIC